MNSEGTVCGKTILPYCYQAEGKSQIAKKCTGQGCNITNKCQFKHKEYHIIGMETNNEK
jgi:hypothetical protein